MRFRTCLPLALAALASLVLLACGGNRSSEQAPPPASSAPAPAAAPAATPAPPQETPAAQTTRADAAPVATRPSATETRKPTPKPQPEPVAESEPAARPEAVAKREPVAKTIATGTELDVELVNGASSKTSKAGDVVGARVTKAVVVDGLTVVPQGAIIDGTVTVAVPLNKIGGTASLGLRFDTLELGDGEKAAIVAGVSQKGKSESGKDAGTIAGATAGGALLGRLLSKGDKTKGALIGAVVGAAAGTGIAAATKGQEVDLPSGTPLVLHLEQPLTVSVQP